MKLKSKEFNQILDELEIFRTEIINLQDRLDHLEKQREINNKKFRYLEDLIIWTDVTTNKKELFHFADGDTGTTFWDSTVPPKQAVKAKTRTTTTNNAIIVFISN